VPHIHADSRSSQLLLRHLLTQLSSAELLDENVTLCSMADPEVLARGGEYLPLPDDGGTKAPELGAGGVKRQSADGG